MDWGSNQYLNRSYLMLSPNSPALNHFVQQHNMATALRRLDELKSRLLPPLPPQMVDDLPDLSELTDDESERPDSTIPFDIGSPVHEGSFFEDIADKTPLNKFGTNETLLGTPSFNEAILEKTLGDFNLNHICTDYPEINTTEYHTTQIN
mmetsp:Transcript_21916/g.30639  ORF Transcript_21916/g.30639 Transcript_21916/m.30639 type:complete len:150 (+) Transcript_21916:78-527(+)